MGERISVIVPIYNAERTLGHCLDSLLAQTYPELEILCVIDGGGCLDGSLEVLNRAAERDVRIKILDYKSDGPATARNAGIDAASGAYIGFVDADDFVDVTMYERLVSLMREKDADIANCGHVSFFADGHEATFSMAFEGTRCVRCAEDLGKLAIEIPDFIWDKLFDARIINDEHIRFPAGRVYGEDTVFLMKYLCQVKRAAFTAAPLYHYNAHSEGSITNTLSVRWYDIFENLKDILYDFRERFQAADFTVLLPYLEELCIRYYDRRANAMLRYDGRVFQLRYVRYSFDFLSRNFPNWKSRMRTLAGIVFPRVKTSLFLMGLYILAPGCLKRPYAERLGK